MAKVALLIGVSEYEPGLNSLPAATKDVEAMRQVLENPDIGGFDEVKVLVNPPRQEMEVAIEILFDNCQKNDLLLLFFSGHGIKDEEGRLYFAARNTRKNDNGVLVKATTVPATSVHEVMSNSRSKHEVVILDCCFSGAFAEGMSARDDGFVDIRNQLGGEGRAVLTSSTSTQYSFEEEGADTSIYTRYIVEGLETGAADRDENGVISVDELHEYAKSKVQEATPAMNPEIYAIREGYKINLANVPNDDPKLKYYREVAYWVKRGNDEIPLIGRTTLDALRDRLTLTSEDAAEIEAKVLGPIEIHKKKSQRYEEAFSNEIKSGFTLSDQTRTDLKRLQQALGLRDEDIALIEAPIIDKQLSSGTFLPPPPPPPQNSNFKYLGACIIGVVIGGIVVHFIPIPKPQVPVQPTPISCDKETYNLNNRISLGEKILLTQDKNPDKEAGVKAFLDGDCKTAIEKFERYRTAKPTDPEALIYLNNAKARENRNRLKIAVSVPIGTEKGIAEEMLRGVAQAQNEVNNKGGINNKALLEVVIANDDNDAKIAPQIASDFVKDKSILAVVGHNSSRASKPASAVYQQSGLVMISPTSYAEDLTSTTTYIFRTAPGIKTIAKSISDYAINKMKKTNFLICTDQNPDNISFKNNFTNVVGLPRVNRTECDISAPAFDPNAVISEAKNSGADALVLALYINKSRDTERRGRALVKANNFQLSLFSTSAVVTKESLEEGKDINGLITSLPWHSTAFPGNPFVKNANQLWKAPVNWRTATSYDATKAIILGLQKSSTRYELQQTLSDPKFSVDGATGQIQFSSGNRKSGYDPSFLIKVQQKPGTDKYEFVPIP
ncbi:ligand binding domain-containing protein [Anabaena sp. 90]|uniref:caspase, EACC1-associated type n=1 Tax=Anabaena sp. 90 TaxID=46234 RepID=UPI00029B7950|nr:ABC transporter substrate-binding protein [Anabaena sp. 90]AFW94010.1 ligand binding domain-containing protein [Anabaena sp. 90]